MTETALQPEDQARANFYALLARLFYAPPDRDLLDTLAAAGPIVDEKGGSPLAAAWSELTRAAAAADPEAVREEYESVFIGTGKAEVTLYTGAYTVKTALDNPLVGIRAFLDSRGLGRRDSVHEPEDHIAALCEVMRHLVATRHASPEEQSSFFTRFLWLGAGPLFQAIAKNDRTVFYRAVAHFAESLFALERSAFEMI